MKQVQSVTMRGRRAARWWAGQGRHDDGLDAPRLGRAARRRIGTGADGRPPAWWSWGGVLLAVLGAIWFVVTLPFRLIFWVFALLGRLAGLVLGFVLMVVGVALWPGPLFIVGVPLFLIGLVLTLRSLN